MAMTGSLSILNVGAGDLELRFNPHQPEEVQRAITMLSEMIRRGYAILIREADGSYVRATDIDGLKGDVRHRGRAGARHRAEDRPGRRTVHCGRGHAKTAAAANRAPDRHDARGQRGPNRRGLTGMSPAPAPAPDDEAALQDLVASCYADPLAFVLQCFPWGEPHTPLADEPGPDAVQREFLEALGAEIRARAFNGADAVMPIRMAESSGHGTGKSALGGMIAAFILSTRPDSIGTVTAGTNTQLKQRTWAAIRHWVQMCLTTHWFHIQATGIYSVFRPVSWKLIPQTCKAENAQSFAGQHAKTSTSWYLFDEASQVDDRIWQTADPGGLTDGEPMFFAWGQLVRNTGYFYRVCQGDIAARWNHRRVDSRTSRFTNKALLEQIATDYGEDSDTFRVRVLGSPACQRTAVYRRQPRRAGAEAVATRRPTMSRWSRGSMSAAAARRGTSFASGAASTATRARRFASPASTIPTARSASACARSCSAISGRGIGSRRCSSIARSARRSSCGCRRSASSTSTR